LLAHSADPSAKKEKNKARGAEKTEHPPERADLIEIYLDKARSGEAFKCSLLRAEEDTEPRGKIGNNMGKVSPRRL